MRVVFFSFKWHYIGYFGYETWFFKCQQENIGCQVSFQTLLLFQIRIFGWDLLSWNQLFIVYRTFEEQSNSASALSALFLFGIFDHQLAFQISILEEQVVEANAILFDPICDRFQNQCAIFVIFICKLSYILHEISCFYGHCQPVLEVRAYSKWFSEVGQWLWDHFCGFCDWIKHNFTTNKCFLSYTIILESIWVLVVEVSAWIESAHILYNFLLFQRYRYGTSSAATLLVENINSNSLFSPYVLLLLKTINNGISGSAFYIVQENNSISGSAFRNLSKLERHMWIAP